MNGNGAVDFNMLPFAQIYRRIEKMKFLLLLLLSLTLYAADKIYEYGDLEEKPDGVLVEVKTHALATGIGKFYYDSGRLRGETPFKEGKREGTGKTYYETGELQGETPFKNDVIEGLKKGYFVSGKVQSETPFVHDKAEGIAKIYYPSGKLQSETPFKENKAEGISKLYYESGKIANEIEFKQSNPVRGFQYDAKGTKSAMSEEQIKEMGL